MTAGIVALALLLAGWYTAIVIEKNVGSNILVLSSIAAALILPAFL